MSIRRLCPGCSTCFPKVTRKPTSWCPDDLRLVYQDRRTKNKRKQDYKRLRRLAYIVNLLMYTKQVMWNVNKRMMKEDFRVKRSVYCNHNLSFPDCHVTYLSCCRMPDIIGSVTQHDHIGNHIVDVIRDDLKVECALVGSNDFFFVTLERVVEHRGSKTKIYNRTPLFSTYRDAYLQLASEYGMTEWIQYLMDHRGLADDMKQHTFFCGNCEEHYIRNSRSQSDSDLFMPYHPRRLFTESSREDIDSVLRSEQPHWDECQEWIQRQREHVTPGYEREMNRRIDEIAEFPNGRVQQPIPVFSSDDDEDEIDGIISRFRIASNASLSEQQMMDRIFPNHE